METVDIGTSAGVAYFVLVLYGLVAKPLLDAWLGGKPVFGLAVAVVLALLSALVGALGAVVGLAIVPEKAVQLIIGGWVLAVVGVVANTAGGAAGRGLARTLKNL